MTRGKAYYFQGTLLVSYTFTSTYHFFLDKTIQWGILHITLTYNFKNYTNITFADDKFNLCDFFLDLTRIHCPITPGTYQLDYTCNGTESTDAVPKLFWPVSNRYNTVYHYY